MTATGYYWLTANLMGMMHLALPLWPDLLRLVSVGGLVATGVLALELGRAWPGTRMAMLGAP